MTTPADPDAAASDALRRYEATRDRADLDDAVDFGRLALAVARLGGPADFQVKRLAVALYFRYARYGNPTDMCEIETLI